MADFIATVTSSFRRQRPPRLPDGLSRQKRRVFLISRPGGEAPVVPAAVSGIQVIDVRSNLYPGAFFRASFVVFMTGCHLLSALVLNWTALTGKATSFAPIPRNSADTNDKRDHPAVLVNQHIHDVADLVVGRIIDALTDPMRNGPRIGWNAWQYLNWAARLHLRDRRRGRLRCLCACHCRCERKDKSGSCDFHHEKAFDFGDEGFILWFNGKSRTKFRLGDSRCKLRGSQKTNRMFALLKHSSDLISS